MASDTFPKIKSWSNTKVKNSMYEAFANMGLAGSTKKHKAESK